LAQDSKKQHSDIRAVLLCESRTTSMKMVSSMLILFLCVGSVQAGAGNFLKPLSATPENEKETETQLTEKKEEAADELQAAADSKAADKKDAADSAEEVKADEKDTADSKALSELDAKAEELNIAAERFGASAEAKKAAEQADKDYQAADKKFTEALEAKDEEGNEAEDNDEDDDEDNDEDNEADEEDMDNDEDEEGKVALIQDPPVITMAEYRQLEEQVDQDYQDAVARDRCFSLATADYRERCKDEREKKMDLDEKLMESRKAALKLLKRRKSNIAGAPKTMSMER